MLAPAAGLSSSGLASTLFPPTFGYQLKILVFARHELDFNYVITRRNLVPGTVSLRSGWIICFALNSALIPPS